LPTMALWVIFFAIRTRTSSQTSRMLL
jgi:hypothetical protein